MSWLFSQALVAEFSAATSSPGAASALSSGTPTPRAYLPPAKMTDFSRPSRFGMTFGPLTDDLGEGLLTWFRADFLAKTSASPGTETDWTASDPASGPKWRGSLARYDPDLRSWKTAQHSLLGDSEEFSETWPRWGTTVGGELYLLPTPALPTPGSESGLLPTPNASDNRDRGNVRNPSIQRRIRIGKQLGLSVLFEKIPCPTCVESMMGWVPNWTALQPLVTDKSPKPPPSPGAPSQETSNDPQH